MFKFDKIILEIFNTLPKNKINWKKLPDYSYITQFQVDNEQKYEIKIINSTDDFYLICNLLEPNFKTKENYETIISLENNNIKAYELLFTNESVENLNKQKKVSITGTGQSASVFSIVINLVNQLLKNEKSIKLLYFKALEESRQSLYSKIIKKLLFDNKDWKYVEIQTDVKIFIMYRNKNIKNLQEKK